MEIVKEIVVFLENRPGTLARVTEALSAQKVNILGFTILNSIDHGALRMVVDKPEVVALTKLDVLPAGQDRCRELADEIGCQVLAVSAIAGDNLRALGERLWECIVEDRDEPEPDRGWPQHLVDTP